MAAVAFHGYTRPLEGTLMHPFFQKGLLSVQSRQAIIANIIQRRPKAMADNPVLHNLARMWILDTPQAMHNRRAFMSSKMTSVYAVSLAIPGRRLLPRTL